MIETGEAIGAAHWLIYLEYGEDDSLGERDVCLIEDWKAKLKETGWLYLCVLDEEPWFSQRYNLHTGDTSHATGPVLTYSVWRKKKA